MYFFTLINNLLTLILSREDDPLSCRVFCPNALIPSPGNCAIGLIFPSYSVSLSVRVNLFNTETAPVIPPLFKPGGANHSVTTSHRFRRIDT